MTKVPLKNAVVKIYDMTGKLVASGYTDESGKFITELLGGRYNIIVEKSGYMPHEQTIDLISDKVKEVVLEKIKPYSIITHPVAVIGDKLGLTQTIPVTVVRTYPKTIISDRLEHQLIKTYPSGNDPNDPRWMPEGGWDEVIDFTSPEDLDKFSITRDTCVILENDIIKFNIETAPWVLGWRPICYERRNYVYCRMVKGGSNKKLDSMAIAFKIVPKTSISWGLFLYMDVDRDGKEMKLHIEFDNTFDDNCCLHDIIGDKKVRFNCLNKWTLVLFDYSTRKVEAYTEDMTEPVTLTLTTRYSEETSYTISINDARHGSSYELLADIFVDWIAIKYA